MSIRAFVEKVMKDVDPNGFVERRPKWKPGIITGPSDAAGQAPLSLPGPSAPSTSSQHHAHVTAPPLIMDQPTDTSMGTAAQTVSHSLHYSNAYPGVLNAQVEIFQPEGFAAGILALPTGVPHDVGRAATGDGVGAWNMDDGSAPLLNSGVSGTPGSIVANIHIQDDVVAFHSSLREFQGDAPHVEDRGDNQDQHSQSDNAGATRMASGSSPTVLVLTQPGPDKNNVSVEVPDTRLVPCELSLRLL